MTISRKQLALVHIAKSRLGLDDDEYRALLLRAAGVTSSRDLDPFGFELVMDEFARLGFVSDFAEENLGRRAGMASAPQVARIRRMWSDYATIAGFAGDDRSLGRWLERFGVSSIRFLPQAKVGKVIGGLSAMTKRKAAKALERAG